MRSQVVTEKTLVEQSGSFEQAVMSNDKAALADFCASKASQAHNQDEAESWAFMRVLFQDDSRRCANCCRPSDTGLVLLVGNTEPGSSPALQSAHARCTPYTQCQIMGLPGMHEQQMTALWPFSSCSKSFCSCSRKF